MTDDFGKRLEAELTAQYLAHQPGRINKRDFRRELKAGLKHYPTAADIRWEKA